MSRVAYIIVAGYFGLISIRSASRDARERKEAVTGRRTRALRLPGILLVMHMDDDRRDALPVTL